MKTTDRSAVIHMASNIAAGIAQGAPDFNSLTYPESSPLTNAHVRDAVARAAVDIAERIIAAVDRKIAETPSEPYVRPPPTRIPGPGESPR